MLPTQAPPMWIEGESFECRALNASIKNNTYRGLLIPWLSSALATSIRNQSSHVAALFVFGASVADSRNNNYINTNARANSPYGEAAFHYPTGKWTHGRTIFDFIDACGIEGCPEANGHRSPSKSPRSNIC
eukprot:Gb_00989 [translate_table: standard]